MFNMSPGNSGIPRALVIALANAMVEYTERGFCGMFNARISDRGNVVGRGGASAAFRFWITFRIVEEGLGELIGS